MWTEALANRPPNFIRHQLTDVDLFFMGDMAVVTCTLHTSSGDGVVQKLQVINLYLIMSIMSYMSYHVKSCTICYAATLTLNLFLTSYTTLPFTHNILCIQHSVMAKKQVQVHSLQIYSYVPHTVIATS